MVDNNTKNLFYRFPRDFGFPQRIPVNNQKELEYQIQKNRGISNVYVSVYPVNLIIDKLFLDFDYGSPLAEAQTIAEYWTSLGHSYIPVASGRSDRIHLYLLFKPHIYGPKAKLLLTKATYNILTAVYGPISDTIATIDGRQKRVFQNFLQQIISPDPACVGDIHRLTRIPNTPRPNTRNFCTYLPPEDFSFMSKSDILSHIKSKHHYTYSRPDSLPLLTDFPFDFEDMPKPKSNFKELNTCPILKNVLRPCLYRHITQTHPINEVRVATTIDLLFLGFPPDKICEIYSTLGWEDFNPKITLDKIHHAQSKNYSPYSCSKLRSMNIPRQCCVD